MPRWPSTPRTWAWTTTKFSQCLSDPAAQAQIDSALTFGQDQIGVPQVPAFLLIDLKQSKSLAAMVGPQQLKAFTDKLDQALSPAAQATVRTAGATPAPAGDGDQVRAPTPRHPVIKNAGCGPLAAALTFLFRSFGPTAAVRRSISAYLPLRSARAFSPGHVWPAVGGRLWFGAARPAPRPPASWRPASSAASASQAGQRIGSFSSSSARCIPHIPIRGPGCRACARRCPPGPGGGRWCV